MAKYRLVPSASKGYFTLERQEFESRLFFGKNERWRYEALVRAEETDEVIQHLESPVRYIEVGR